MIIQQPMLKQLLDHKQAWSWRRTDWRRVGRKILRFVAWGKAVR